MLKIKAPDTYINEYGALKKAGEYISEYGRRAFIIAGKTAWSKVEPILSNSLNEHLISFDITVMDGYPTYDKVKEYSDQAFTMQADMVIGVGGGKICDMAKAVGNHRNIPVVMIPTVPATCACWAARSIIYKDDGDFDLQLWNAQNSRLVIADTGILKDAPVRYLASGIMDTFAKWYEFEPLIERDRTDIVLRQDVAIARLAYDLLKDFGFRAYDKTADDEEFRQVIDAIIFLAGASGSFANGAAYRGFAHSYYYASTRIPESRHLLHGEKVAFGLLVQFILSGENEAFIKEYLADIKHYGIVDTPLDWGKDDPGPAIRKIAGALGDWGTAERVEAAIREAAAQIKGIK